MNELFDFNGDGVLDIGEQYMEYMTFLAVTGGDEEDNDEEDGEDPYPQY